MTSSQARKGSRYERDVVAYLRMNGHQNVERSNGAGRPDDRGDIDGLPGWVLEPKIHKTLALVGWRGNVEVKRVNAHQPFAAVVAKRRGKSADESYVILSWAGFGGLIAHEEDR